MIGEDRESAAAALYELSDKAPLVGYPLIREVYLVKNICCSLSTVYNLDKATW